MAYIFGTPGADILDGTLGNDTIDHKGGEDVINGSTGIDTVLFFDHSSHYKITTLLGVTRVFGYGRAALDYTGDEALLIYVEQIQFSNTLINLGLTPPGVLLGNTGSELIRGTLGNDIIDPRGGSDAIDGNHGFDTVLFFDTSDHYGFTLLAEQIRVFGYGRAALPYVGEETSLVNVEAIQFLDRRFTYGSDADDTLPTWSGNDTVYGGNGIDTVLIESSRSANTLSRSSAAVSVNGPAGKDTLNSVERLQFFDRSVAFDLQEGEVGYNTALMGAAALGRSFVSDPAAFGAGLRFADEFVNMQQLAEGVINLGVYDHLTDRQFVDLICQNINHVPNAEQAQLYDFVLSFGIDRSQVLRYFAESDYNEQSINLLGLQQTGIDFV